MAAAQESVAFNIDVTGAQQSAARIDSVTKALARAGSASNDNARAASAAGKAWQAAGGNISKAASVLSVVDGNMGKLVGTLGKAAGAASMFSSALGGPLGLAAGGLIGAFALWSDYTATQEKKLEDLTAATKKAAFAAMTFDGQLKKITGQRDKADLQRRLSSGEESSAAYEAEIGRLQAMNAAGAAGQSAGAINPEYRNRIQYRNEARIAELEGFLENARAREQIAAAAAQAESLGAIGDGPGAGAKKEGSGISRAGLQLDQIRAAGDARKQAYSDQMAALEEVDKLYQSQRTIGEQLAADERRALREAEYDQWKTDRETRLDLIRAGEAEEQRLAAETAAKRKMVSDMALASLQGYANVSAGALQKVAKGQKVANAAFLESIGDQAFADGTFRVLQGVAMLAALNPAGAAVIAAGTAEAAFGLALGSSAARGAGGSTSEARRAARGGGGASGGGGSSEPTTVRRPGDDGPREVRSNIVVQVNTLVADERTGERVMQSIEAANMKLGRKMAPSVVGRA